MYVRVGQHHMIISIHQNHGSATGGGLHHLAIYWSWIIGPWGGGGGGGRRKLHTHDACMYM